MQDDLDTDTARHDAEAPRFGSRTSLSRHAWRSNLFPVAGRYLVSTCLCGWIDKTPPPCVALVEVPDPTDILMRWGKMGESSVKWLTTVSLT